MLLEGPGNAVDKRDSKQGASTRRVCRLRTSRTESEKNLTAVTNQRGNRMESIVVHRSRSDRPAIARRVGVGKHVVLSDRSEANAKAAADVMSKAGYAVSVATVDVSSREAVHALVTMALDSFCTTRAVGSSPPD